jgi:uncharacterized protein YjbI with pentapeptide repeats
VRGNDLYVTFYLFCNFYGANLENTNFASANLQYNVFVKADLSNANLSGANLKSTFLTDADLSGANLDSVKLDGAILNCKNHSVCEE